MPILTNKFVEDTLAEWAQDDYPLTINQEIQAKNLFFQLMNEQQNSTKDLKTQESLLAEIARKLSYGEKPESVFRQHGDNRHMNYFDIFLSPGTADDILETLKHHGISSDILKGIKKNIPFDITISNARVVQELDDGEDKSPSVDSFSIYKDGKLIYQWTPEKDYIEYNIDNDNNNNNDNIVYVPREKEIQYTKSGKVRKSELINVYVTPTKTYTMETMRSSANPNLLVIAYRDERGRFTKK